MSDVRFCLMKYNKKYNTTIQQKKLRNLEWRKYFFIAFRTTVKPKTSLPLALLHFPVNPGWILVKRMLEKGKNLRKGRTILTQARL